VPGTEVPDWWATTLVSVPLRALTVMPADGSAALAPLAGEMAMAAAASAYLDVARGLGLGKADALRYLEAYEDG